MNEDVNNNPNNPTPENNINPEELFNKPEEQQETVDVAPTPAAEEPVTLTPEPAEEETAPAPEPVPTIEAAPTPVENPVSEPSGEIGPAQTDLNQVPPTPVNPGPTITTGQDATSTGFTEKIDKGKKIKKPLIIVGCVVAVILLGYFVIWPMVANVFMSSPKNVFEATVNKISTSLNQKLEQVNLGASMYEVEGTFDTNIEELKSFANYTYKFRGGMDSKNKLIEGSAAMLTKDNKEIGGTIYVKNNFLYYKLTSDERIVKAEDLSQDESYKTLFENSETIKSEDLQYLVDKVKELVFSELTEKDFTKENNYAMKVNGSEVKTTKNNLTIDKAKFTTIYKAVTDGLYKDSKAMEIIAKLGTTKEDFKKDYIDVDYNEIEEDMKIIVNIYTIKSEVVGVDISGKEETVMYFYSNEGNFESAFLPGQKDDEMTFVGVKDGDATNATLKVAGEEVAKLKIYTFEENEVKFDYTFNMDEEQTMTGTIALKENDNVTDVEFSAKAGSEFFSIKGKVKVNNDAKIAQFDDSKAVTLTEDEQTQMLMSFLESTKGTPLDFLTSNLGGMNYNNPNYYDDYNYNINASELQPNEGF